MHKRAESIGTDALGEAWSRLRSHLHDRCRALNDEVSHYPTPIARCDEQLTALLEQRSNAAWRLRLAVAADAVIGERAADRAETLTEFLRKTADATGDGAEAALREDLEAALAAYSKHSA